MGEYAYRKSDGEHIKIGTCECLRDIRYEDRGKVYPDPHSLDTMTAMDCFWRLPFPDEDSLQPGEYSGERGIRLFKRVPGRYHTEECHDWNRIPFTPTDLEPGRLQLRHECGLRVSIPCYHGLGEYTDTDEISIGWNGKDPFQLELIYVKNTKAGVVPVFRCRHCERMWRCEWSEIIDYIPDDELKQRLSVHWS